jgi:hypothetical protein
VPLEFDNVEDIPEPFHDDFVQPEGKGKWVPKGYVAKDVHEEMKGRMSTQASKIDELEGLRARWGEDDPDALRQSAAEAAKATKRLEKLEKDLAAAVKAKTDLEAAGTGEDPKKVEQLVKDALEALRAELSEQHQAEVEQHAAKYGTLESTLKERESRLDVLEIDHAVDTAAAEVPGFRKEVLPLARMLARQVFRRGQDGKVLPYGEDGKVLRDADKVLTPSAWLAKQRDQPATKGWFDAPASGGGTNGDNPKGGAAATKTITKAEYDQLDAAAQHQKVGVEKYKVVDA